MHDKMMSSPEQSSLLLKALRAVFQGCVRFAASEYWRCKSSSLPLLLSVPLWTEVRIFLSIEDARAFCMKIRLTFVIWLCALMLIGCLNASEKDDSVIRRVTPQDGQFYSWLQHGLLFHRSIQNKKGYYLYCGKNGYLTEVRSNSQFSAMIREEVDGRDALLAFIREKLPQVFYGFISSEYAFVIDSEYLNYRKSLDPEVWQGKEVRRSLLLLSKLVLSKPVIGEANWSWVFYTTLSDGSIEKWELNGTIQPFLVERSVKTTVEKAGAVVPIPAMR